MPLTHSHRARWQYVNDLFVLCRRCESPRSDVSLFLNANPHWWSFQVFAVDTGSLSTLCVALLQLLAGLVPLTIFLRFSGSRSLSVSPLDSSLKKTLSDWSRPTGTRLPFVTYPPSKDVDTTSALEWSFSNCFCHTNNTVLQCRHHVDTAKGRDKCGWTRT